MRRVAVVYDLGAASPLDISESLDGVAEPVFVCPDSEHNRVALELVSELGPFVDASFGDVATEVAKFEPDGIVTYSEFALEWTAGLAARLDLPFHGVDLARTLTRKHVQRQRLNAAGVSAVETFLLTDLASARRIDPRFPCVLKPNAGAGARNTYLVENRADFLRVAESVLGDPEGYVLEQRIEGQSVEYPWGDYVSVESAVVDGSVEHLGITGKFALATPFRERGGYLPAQLGHWDVDAITSTARAAVRALGVHTGLCHTELKISPDGPVVIEVNGRLGGHVYDLFKRGCGVDLVALGARIALGEAVEVPEAVCDGVVFHYYGTTPNEVGRVVEINGVREARALPGVERLDMHITRGAVADWRLGVKGKTFVCTGRTGSHDELSRLVGSLEETVDIRYCR